MKLQLAITSDGSPTLFVPEWNEHYHSVHGAVRESMHVFIHAGLDPALELNKSLHILEVGLGTGFNALLTLEHIQNTDANIQYDALEPFPPDMGIIQAFKPEHLIQLGSSAQYFHQMHAQGWEKHHQITSSFALRKLRSTLANFSADGQYNLIYFDAFSPNVQPELWTEENFSKLFLAMVPNGILVTYCAKGAVRRAMQSAGFTVERLPGPPGKREMLRAIKK